MIGTRLQMSSGAGANHRKAGLDGFLSAADERQRLHRVNPAAAACLRPLHATPAIPYRTTIHTATGQLRRVRYSHCIKAFLDPLHTGRPSRGSTSTSRTRSTPASATQHREHQGFEYSLLSCKQVAIAGCEELWCAATALSMPRTRPQQSLSISA